MNIFSRFYLEVKETGAKSVAFLDAPAHRIYVAFLDIAHSPTGEAPYIQHRHLGALIALAY
jgi:hypothetical protein